MAKKKNTSNQARNSAQPVTARAGTSMTHRPRIDAEIETRILEIAFLHPAYGQDRVARELRGARVFVSASGVRYVWQRHNLETMEKRVSRIEKHLGNDDASWSKEQFIARDRVHADRRSRSIVASVVGQNAADVSRSNYILMVAARLLREQGYDATSLRDIADRAQIPVGSMYYHFQSKEELFAAVYEEGVRRLTAAVHSAIKPLRDPWDRLERACITHLQHLCGGDDFTAISIPTNLPRIHGPVRTQLTEANDGYEDTFRQLIEHLHPPKNISSGLLRLQLLGALNWTWTWFRPGKFAPEDIARNLVNALRFGLDRRVSTRLRRQRHGATA